jgi:hypothetical protein
MKKNNFLNIIFNILPILIIGVFALLINKRMFPVTEGWWETYAWLSSLGTIYKDFNLALPPLYINLTEIILKFTDELLVVRYYMVGIYIINILLLYYLCRIVTRSEYAIIGVFISQVLLITQNPVWLSKDYHTLVSVLTCLFIIYAYKYILDNKLSKINISILGIITGFIVLTKQNIAFVLIISSILTIFIVNKYLKKGIKDFSIYSLFLVSTLCIYSYYLGWNWISVYINNDSKGRSGTVLFRIFQEPEIWKLTEKSIFFTLALSIIYYIYNRHIDLAKKIIFIGNEKYKKINLFTGSNDKICGYIFVIIFIKIIFFSNNTNYFYISILTFFLLAIVISLHFKKFKNIGTLSISLIFLAYAGTMTAGYNNVSLEILIAIFTTIVLTYVISIFNLNKFIILLIIFIISTNLFYKNKIINSSYDWWGYSTDGLLNSNYSSNNPKLKGINFDFQTYEILSATDKAILDLRKGDSIFSYPSIPLFYWLYSKLPIVKNPVQWFDVFPSKETIGLIADLKHADPKVIFWMRPGLNVYEGHLVMKKTQLPMAVIDNYLLNQIEIGKYKITDSIVLMPGKESDNDNNYLLYTNSPTEYDFICSMCTPELLDKMLRLGNITNYTKSMDYQNTNYIRIIFKNRYQAAVFIKKYNLMPLQQKDYIFYILKRND